jgi:hypothetical protein
MKKYLYVFLALLSFSSVTASAQSKPTEQQIRSLICHKWKAAAMELQGKEIPMTVEEMYIAFLPDGTYVSSQEGYKSSGKWVYIHNTRTVITGGILKKIVAIDDKQLKFRSKMDGQEVIVTMNRID